MPSQPPLLAAANYLRHLLNTRASYRRLWMAHAVRSSGGSPNIGAVSRVLVEYHWANPHLVDWDPPGSHRGYKDRVARALAAEALSPQTIDLFANAFRMGASERDMLLLLLDEGDQEPVRDWHPPGFPSSTQDRKYRTVSLQELHEVGPDRVPVAHRTIHTIEALESGVGHHLYCFDTPEVTVRAVNGATAGPVARMEGSDYWCCRLSFHQPLSEGQIRFFEYATDFEYQEVPAPEFRRGSMFPLQMLSIRVQFHHLQLPEEIRWAHWDDMSGAPRSSRPVGLDEDHAACEVMTDVQPGLILGFTWAWPDG